LLSAFLARRLAGPAAGLVAAGLFAFYPRAVLMAGVLAAENLFTPLLLLWALVLITPKQTAGTACGLGTAAGLMTLTRAVAYPFSGLLFIRLLLERNFSRRAIGNAFLAIVIQHAVLLPWGLRNALSLGSFSVLTSTGGVNLFIGNSPDATGAWYDWRPALERLDPRASGAVPGSFGLDRIARETAIDWIRKEPAAAVRLYFKKLRIIFTDEAFLLEFAITGQNLSPPWPAVDVLPAGHPVRGRANTIGRVLDISYKVLIASGILGWILLSFGRQRVEASLLAIGAASFPLVAAVYLASSRFRWPAEDLLVPLAAAGVVLLITRARSYNRRPSERPPESPNP
jgi:hypothetical protein